MVRPRSFEINAAIIGAAPTACQFTVFRIISDPPEEKAGISVGATLCGRPHSL